MENPKENIISSIIFNPRERWPSLVTSLQTKIKEHAELRIFISNLNRGLERKKGELLIDANEIKDGEGKKVYSNAEMRESYVTRKMADLEGMKEKRQKEEEMIRLEAEIKGLEIEFKALRSDMELLSSCMK